MGNSSARSVNGYKHGRVPRAVRRTQLLELAEQLFMEKGYGGFSIDDLCRAAGISRPIVYEHFGSKDGIYIACLRRIREEFEQALLAAAASAPDLATTVERSADAWFSILERDPQRWSLVYGGATGLVGPLADTLAELRDLTVQQIGLVAARFAPRAEREHVTQWAHAVSGAGEQLGRWWLRNPAIPRERVVAFYADFLHAAMSHLIESTAQAAAGAEAPQPASSGSA
jgi:AcrR family transcriptional regulator